ncbi:MAG: hypothetical protein J6386_18530 [Candidatus Synoicihabitans palmerolidicus]|nr:hypothetical protein [Candidatus Synoicihabitans palmerolidicus]
MTFSTRFFRILALFVGVSFGGGVAEWCPLGAQGKTETKIRLLADALRARDNGDLEAAERNLLELSEMAPDDPAVKRMLLGVQQTLAEERAQLNRAETQWEEIDFGSSMPGEPAAWFEASTLEDDRAAAEAALEAEIAELASEEETRQRELIEAARLQARDAQVLAEEGRCEAALATLDTAMHSMPENPLTLPVIKGLGDQRDEIQRVQIMALAATRELERPAVTSRGGITTTGHDFSLENAEPGRRVVGQRAREFCGGEL